MTVFDSILLPGSRRTSLALSAALVLSACKDGGAPQIQDPGDQTAVVGQQLTIDIQATDPEGDALDFSFAANGVPDLGQTAAMTIAPDGHGVFTFTPLASQLGSHLFDFIVSDGKNDSKLTININVVGAGGDGTQPIFRKPLGNGTVLDLEQAECAEVEIEIEDADSTTIVLGQNPPLIQDAELSADASGLSGRWNWCPNREQLEASDRYELILSAQDLPENPPTLKNYTIVLRRRSGSECPGDPPAIDPRRRGRQHPARPRDRRPCQRRQGHQERADPALQLRGSGQPHRLHEDDGGDDVAGLGRHDERRLDRLHPQPDHAAGHGCRGRHLVRDQRHRQRRRRGDCDHLSDKPGDGTHRMHVVNDGSGQAPVCGACSYDVQCGGFSNLCLPQQTGSFCGTGCSSDDECQADYVCSPTEVQSVEGVGARQCVPLSGSCSAGGGGACTEDGNEDNDDLDQALSLGAFPAGESIAGSLCTDTDDWYRFDLSAGAIAATLAGPSDVDIDIVLTDADGVLVANSAGLQSDEHLMSSCVPSGTYFLRVYAANSSARGDYTLDVDVDATSCGGGGGGEGDCCTDTNMPGCEDEAVTACVCAFDAFCCDNEWDNTCATEAQSMCDLQCGGGGDSHDCCVTGAAGCDDAAVEACVCAADSFCCETEWDAMCVAKVGTQLCAASCDPDDADGPCCTEHAAAGCEVDSVESCVCAEDALCCSSSWDDVCVMEIESLGCGMCP